MANVARVEATITAQNQLRPGLSSAARDLDRFRNAQTKATALAYVGSMSFSGTFIGPRYSVAKNGVIDGTSANASFFPGSTLGSSASGGLYV